MEPPPDGQAPALQPAALNKRRHTHVTLLSALSTLLFLAAAWLATTDQSVLAASALVGAGAMTVAAWLLRHQVHPEHDAQLWAKALDRSGGTAAIYVLVTAYVAAGDTLGIDQKTTELIASATAVAGLFVVTQFRGDVRAAQQGAATR